MDADSRFQKWQEWLDIIYSDIQQLLDFPSYGELDAVLDYLEEIFKKYSLVLRADSSDLLPMFLYDWK